MPRGHTGCWLCGGELDATLVSTRVLFLSHSVALGPKCLALPGEELSSKIRAVDAAVQSARRGAVSASA